MLLWVWQVEKDKSSRGCMSIYFYIPAAITHSRLCKSIQINMEKTSVCFLTNYYSTPEKQIKELVYLCCNQENTRWMAQSILYLDGTVPILFHWAGQLSHYCQSTQGRKKKKKRVTEKEKNNTTCYNINAKKIIVTFLFHKNHQICSLTQITSIVIKLQLALSRSSYICRFS